MGVKVFGDAAIQRIGSVVKTVEAQSWYAKKGGRRKPNFVTTLGQSKFFGVVTNAAITPGNSGTISVLQNGSVMTPAKELTVHLRYMHNSEQVSVGKQVLVEYFPNEEAWIIIGAECEA